MKFGKLEDLFFKMVLVFFFIENLALAVRFFTGLFNLKIIRYSLRFKFYLYFNLRIWEEKKKRTSLEKDEESESSSFIIF